MSRHFTAQAMKDLLRPGTIIELRPSIWGKVGIDQIILGTLAHKVWETKRRTGVNKHGRESQVKMRGSKGIVIYSAKRGDAPKDGRYRLYPLTSLLQFHRQMEALFNMRPDNYPALMMQAPDTGSGKDAELDESLLYVWPDKCPALMTQAPSDVTQDTGSGKDEELDVFDEYSNCSEGVSESSDEEERITTQPVATRGYLVATTTLTGSLADNSPTDDCPFNIPKLNDTQEKSMNGFLCSPDGTLTLVQGEIFVPPD